MGEFATMMFCVECASGTAMVQAVRSARPRRHIVVQIGPMEDGALPAASVVLTRAEARALGHALIGMTESQRPSGR